MSIQEVCQAPTNLDTTHNNDKSSLDAKSVLKLHKTPVALRFVPNLLQAIDEIASRRGMSRNAIISYWCSKGVENE